MNTVELPGRECIKVLGGFCTLIPHEGEMEALHPGPSWISPYVSFDLAGSDYIFSIKAVVLRITFS